MYLKSKNGNRQTTFCFILAMLKQLKKQNKKKQKKKHGEQSKENQNKTM